MSEGWWDTLQVEIVRFLSWGESATGVTVAYSDLPQPPTPEPPAQTSIDALDPAFQSDFLALEADLGNALAAAGFHLRRLETKRDNARQAWLYGIGRKYQAAGRDGIVTNVSTVHGPHGEGRAADYSYPPLPGVAADADLLGSTLAAVADAHPEFTWGGRFLSLSDPAHWEHNV